MRDRRTEPSAKKGGAVAAAAGVLVGLCTSSALVFGIRDLPFPGAGPGCTRRKTVMSATQETRIVLNEGVPDGKPVVCGTRLAVEFVIGLMAEGWSEADIFANYPGITREDIAACLAYAREVMSGERVFPTAAWRKRFLADENFPGAAVSALEKSGHDVSWVRTRVPGAGDAEVLALANAEARVLLAFDKDFGERARAARLSPSCGVVLFRLPMPPASDVARLAVLIDTRSDWAGNFSVIEPGRVCMRALQKTK
jgi:uncharacterized protein (DUF433 family)